MMDEQSRSAGDSNPASPVPEQGASTPPLQRSSGSSAGSDRALVLESDQKTVISKTPPLEVPGTSPVSVNDLGRLLVGQRLGHFVLEQFVGGGGMGAVFRATDTELGRTVAVKVVSGAHNDIETLRRFKNEAQSAARLDHQNIARVYYVGEDQGWHYIVFEFIQGVNVRDLVMQRGPLPLEEALHYTLQVAEALEHAARRDVVHRDIKPSNVLVMQDGTVKVVDMGLARLHQVESPTNDLTASGVTLGTFDYISPEQARDPRNADVRSDLYSLGCTLYYMLTGRPPFPAGTVLQKLLSHSSEPPPDPRDLRPELSEEVTDVLHRLLAKNPSDRFQSPGDFIGRLLLLADELGLTLAGRRADLLVTRTSTPLTSLETVLPWVVPLGVLILVVLLIEIFSPTSQIAIGHPVLQPPIETKYADSAEADVQPAATQKSATKSQATPTSDGAPNSDSAAQQRSDTNSSANQDANNRNSTKPQTSAQSSATTSKTSDPVASATDNGNRTTTGNSSEAGNRTNDGNRSESGNSGSTASQANTDTSSPNESSNTASAGSGDVQRVTRIIVAPTMAPSPSDGVIVSTLDAAIQKLQDLSDVDSIELWFNGEIVSAPLEAIPKDKLAIRAGDGFSPVVCFRPDLRSLSSDHRMIEIGGNTIWEKIHFRLDLPLDPSSKWSLFGLRELQSAEFRNCTFTVRNIDEHGILHEDVSFFEFLPPQVSKRMEMNMNMEMDGMTSQPMSTVTPVLRLDNCAARGQATFVRAEAAYPFSFSWRQGLLITNERLFALGGAAEKVATWDARVEFNLEDLTAAMDKGLGLMHLDYKAPHPVNTSVDIKNCVLLTNVDAPFLQHSGFKDANELNLAQQTALSYQGDNNFYPARNLPKNGIPEPRIIWRLLANDSQKTDITIRNLPQLWYMELPSQVRVIWKSSETGPPADFRQYDRHTKAHYEMDSSSSNLARTAGFKFKDLPDFPQPQQAESSSSPSSGSQRPPGE